MLAKILETIGLSKGKVGNTKHPQRFNDAIIVIKQDNATKSLPIEATNELALGLLGYNPNELLKHDLRNFLSSEIVDLINDGIEFKADTQQIDEVLKKASGFKMRTKQGAEVPLKIRVIRTIPASGSARFQIVMNDRSLFESLLAYRLNEWVNIPKNEIYHNKTNLLKRERILGDIGLISKYAGRNSANESCFVIFKFVNYKKNREIIGEDAANAMVMAMAEQINKSKRESDIVGLLKDNCLILVLMETPRDKVMIPVNRMLSGLSEEIKPEISLKHGVITADSNPEELIQQALNS